MDTWTGIISILSLLSGNVEGHLGHKGFNSEAECKSTMDHDLPILQQHFDESGEKVKLTGACTQKPGLQI
jgi:hypothetical protein